MLCGCNKVDEKDVINKYEKILESSDSYELNASMEILSNDEIYNYDVIVDYEKPSYYKVKLTNKDTNNTQIILKNDSGVYVITPSVNKSYKFQSEWPNNGSQSYILESILEDIKNDSNINFEEKEDSYVITSSVNYPNNSSLVSQKITFSKDMLPTSVEVFDQNEVTNIKVKILDINFEPKFSETNFVAENNITNETLETGSMDEIVYPMYLPTGTVFEGEETVQTDDTQRVILTFTGDKSFIMIEEVSSIPKEFEISNISGEVVFYENIIGSLTDTSLSWTSNGKDYYIIADNLTNEEILKVASSVSTVSLTK